MAAYLGTDQDNLMRVLDTDAAVTMLMLAHVLGG